MMVKAFAEANGYTVQWARRQRARNTGEWQSFLAARSSGGTPVVGAAAVGVLREPLTELERAVMSKEGAWQTYTHAMKLAQDFSGSDISARAAVNRALREAQKAYQDAADYEKKQAIEALRWVPIGKVEGIRTACGQLAEVVQNLRTTVAGSMPAEMRPAFYKAFDASRPAWNAGVKIIDDYILTLLPCPV